jgi:hypothetical protein
MEDQDSPRMAVFPVSDVACAVLAAFAAPLYQIDHKAEALPSDLKTLMSALWLYPQIPSGKYPKARR